MFPLSCHCTLSNRFQTAKPKKKKSKSAGAAASSATTSGFAAATGQVAPASATTTGTDTQINTGNVRKVNASHAAPTVEELGDEED